MGIHYDYKSKRGERAMLKQAKREARLASKKAKKGIKIPIDSNSAKDAKVININKLIKYIFSLKSSSSIKLNMVNSYNIFYTNL